VLGSSFYYVFLLVERLKDPTQRRNIVSIIVNHIDRRYKLFIIFETTIWLHLSINILSFVSKIKNRDKVFLVKFDKVFSVKFNKVFSVKFIEVFSVKFNKVLSVKPYIRVLGSSFYYVFLLVERLKDPTQWWTP